jgi:hypothetical protein
MANKVSQKNGGAIAKTSISSGHFYWSTICCSIEVYKTTVTIASECCFVSGKFFSTMQDDADEFSFSSHPFLPVKTDESWCKGVYCVVTPNTDL